MRIALYSIAVIALIIWIIGFFIYSLGVIIHLLLIVALVAVVYDIIKLKMADFKQ